MAIPVLKGTGENEDVTGPEHSLNPAGEILLGPTQRLTLCGKTPPSGPMVARRVSVPPVTALSLELSFLFCGVTRLQ